MTLLDTLNKNDRFAASIGAQLTEIRAGYAKAELTVKEQHLNGANVCQGALPRLLTRQARTAKRSLPYRQSKT